MGRILALLSLCLLSGCYSYPPYDYGYRQPYPPGYVAGYPAYGPQGPVPGDGSQTYAPYSEQNYQGADQPGYATSVPEDGQPIYLTPPFAAGQPAEGYNQPYGASPPDQNQSQFYQGPPPGYRDQPASCDTPENPVACN
jgi:hypothetical protein